jgi:hypothetical protein
VACLACSLPLERFQPSGILNRSDWCMRRDECCGGLFYLLLQGSPRIVSCVETANMHGGAVQWVVEVYGPRRVRKGSEKLFKVVIHHIVCLGTGAQPLPKRVIHRVRCTASSFKLYFLLFSAGSFSSCLSLLPRLLILSKFPSITRFRRQFLRKM